MTCRPLPLLLLPLLLAACGSGVKVGGSTSSAPNPVDAPPAAVGATAKPNPGDQTQTAAEAQLLRELNAARAVGRTCGNQYMPAVGALTWNGYLAKSARAYAQDMAARSFFAHVDPEGGTFEKRNEAAGYIGWKALGENIIGGYALNEMTAGWLASPAHCAAIMAPEYDEVGVTSLNQPGSSLGTYGVQEFGAR